MAPCENRVYLTLVKIFTNDYTTVRWNSILCEATSQGLAKVAGEGRDYKWRRFDVYSFVEWVILEFLKSSLLKFNAKRWWPLVPGKIIKKSLYFQNVAQTFQVHFLKLPIVPGNHQLKSTKLNSSIHSTPLLIRANAERWNVVHQVPPRRTRVDGQKPFPGSIWNPRRPTSSPTASIKD